MTAATTEEPRPARGDETRRRILEAAMALYARRGVKGTGLAAIGQAAGVTHAGVLYHFGSSLERPASNRIDPELTGL